MDRGPPTRAPARESERPAAVSAPEDDPPTPTTAAEIWEAHKGRLLRIDERQTLNAVRTRFGEDIAAQATRAAVDEGAEYASRIELAAARIAGTDRGAARPPPSKPDYENDPYLKLAKGGQG